MKKSLAVLLSVIMLLSTLCLPALASEPVEYDAVEAALSQYTEVDQLRDLENGFIDPTISQAVLDSISVAAFTSSASDKMTTASSDIPADATYSVRNLGTVSEGNEVIGNLYALTASTRKTEQDSTTVGSVYAWMTLVWIDHPGTQNELVSVSGGWTPNGVSLSSRTVRYGVRTGFTSMLESLANPTTNSYYYTGYNDFFGLTVYASSSAVYLDNGQTTYVTVNITPTIFD